MNFTRSLLFLASALLLPTTIAPPAHAQASASAQLRKLDETLYSGSIDAYVSVFDAPDAKGGTGAPKRFRAQLLFERPDRFRIVVRPGEKNEYRAAAEAGILRWRDLGTGLSGKINVENATDPLALALLGTAGELLRFGASQDVATSKINRLSAARLAPKSLASGVESALVFFGEDGEPIGFDFEMTDRSRVFVAVTAFERNAPTSPGDFQP